MKDEYDFSQGQRGKFFQPNLALSPPIHLDPEVRALLSEQARAKGVSLDDLVNILLRKELEPISCATPS